MLLTSFQSEPLNRGAFFGARIKNGHVSLLLVVISHDTPALESPKTRAFLIFEWPT